MMDFLYSLPPVLVTFCMFIVFLAGHSMGYRSGCRDTWDESRRLNFISWKRHMKRFDCTPREGAVKVWLDLEEKEVEK